jgi:hypothetical protein
LEDTTMTIQNTTTTGPCRRREGEREGDYARLDEDGISVLCGRVQADGTVCREVLLGRLTLRHRDPPHEHYTVLVFVHDGWGEKSGLWRETAEVRARRRHGEGPRQRTSPPLAPRMWSGMQSLASAFGFTALPALPAELRCPGCGHRRLVVGERPGATGALSVGWVCERPGT